MNGTLYSAEEVRKLRAERDAAVADKDGAFTVANRYQAQYEAMYHEIDLLRAENRELLERLAALEGG